MTVVISHPARIAYAMRAHPALAGIAPRGGPTKSAKRSPLMRLSIVFALLAVASAGCNRSPSHAATPATAADMEAQQIFTSRCSPCHGAEGNGNGAAAAALTPRPRNFHDGAWQTATTDAQIEHTIVVGGAAVGKSPAMPANPDLANKPEVVAALRTLIRGYR